MEPRNCDKNSCIEEDSDETVLDTSSLELTVTQSQPRKQVWYEMLGVTRAINNQFVTTTFF